MRKNLILVSGITLTILITIVGGFIIPVKEKTNPPTVKTGFALVELFTSEGCSSCPAADEIVAACVKDYPSGVFILGFHVDYWNYLGWKDVYSHADYSARQKQYSESFQLNSIYTPQVIVNGKTEFTGSDKPRLYRAIEKELNTANESVIEVSAKQAAHNDDISVHYSTTANKQTVICIALVQREANTTILKGENKGRVLHHINVVRSFQELSDHTGSASIRLPAGMKAQDGKVIAFVQNKSDRKIACIAESFIQ